MKKGRVALGLVGAIAVAGGLYCNNAAQKKAERDKFVADSMASAESKRQDSIKTANQIAELEGKLTAFELYNKRFSIDTTLYAQGQIDSVPLKSARGPWGTQEHIYLAAGLGVTDSTLPRTWYHSVIDLNGASPDTLNTGFRNIPEERPMSHLLPPEYLNGFRKKLDSLMNPSKYIHQASGEWGISADASDYKQDTAITKSKYGYACRGTICDLDETHYGYGGMISGD
jgi:hypothetical protein